jgi:hypothetical protein
MKMKNNKNLSLRSVRIVKINRSARAKLDSFDVNVTVIEREDRSMIL